MTSEPQIPTKSDWGPEKTHNLDVQTSEKRYNDDAPNMNLQVEDGSSDMTLASPILMDPTLVPRRSNVDITKRVTTSGGT